MVPLVLVGLVTAVLVLTVVLMIRGYRAFRGTRLVLCPETGKTAAVEVDARHAAETAIYLPKPELRLTACSRWPERERCRQECLRQIGASPHDCLVRTIVTRWYEGKMCLFCRQPIQDIDWSFHKAALLRPGLPTSEWSAIRPENLPAVLDTALPVCWSCHLAESFRREHSELLIERPARHAAMH